MGCGGRVMTLGAAYLDQTPGAGIGVHDGACHIQAHSVQLLNLPPPDQCESPASSVNLCPSRPVTLQAEGETGLISKLSVSSR